MKTAVYQSYRTEDVPVWIERCMASVRAWTHAQGFDYAFVDDAIFERVPDWYRRKTNNSIWLNTDLGRLELAKEYLNDGYARAIWVDADILIFDPEAFQIDVTRDYAFCREIWIERTAQNDIKFKVSTNNSISVYVEGNAFLDFYVHACHNIIGHKAPPFNGLEVGTRFLSNIHRTVFVRTLKDIGLFSPLVTHDMIAGDGTVVDAYINYAGRPIRAVNLCGSHVGKDYQGVCNDEAAYDAVVDILTASRGEAVNGKLIPTSSRNDP